jgi:hypothetical protein
MRKQIEAFYYELVIYYADALLRTSLELRGYVLPVLAQLAGDKRGSEALKAVLATNPPWRSAFLAALPSYATDARTPLDLLLAVRANSNSAPPTTEDIKPYLDLLISHKIYGLAYYTWLQFLPPRELRHAGFLFNGNFDEPPSGLPFDWVITPGAGVTIDIVPRADKSNAHALLVEFQYGRVDFHGVTELIMLAPGNYQFTGKYKGELVGQRGLKWRIVCADGAGIAESSMITGMSPDWRDVTFKFTVPTADCGAQYVRLDLDARSESEHLISGSIYFDELQISRVQAPPT